MRTASLYGRANETLATRPWTGQLFKLFFEKATSDVFILLDCCAAASSATISGNEVTETIAAFGFERRCPPPSKYSFSNTLIEVLEDWKARPSFSAALLHTEMLFQLKRKRPEKGREGGPRMEWCSTPIHVVYTSDTKAPSIELSRREFPFSVSRV